MLTKSGVLRVSDGFYPLSDLRVGDVVPDAGTAIETLTKYLTAFYTWLQSVVRHYLEIYVFSKNPELAARYGDLIVLMVTLTVIYALLEIFEGFKRVLRIILALGWLILLLVIALNYFHNS